MVALYSAIVLPGSSSFQKDIMEYAFKVCKENNKGGKGGWSVPRVLFMALLYPLTFMFTQSYHEIFVMCPKSIQKEPQGAEGGWGVPRWSFMA